MQFEWDEKKNEKNIKKHKIMFEEAKTIWLDPNAQEHLDFLHCIGEERFVRIGYSIKGQLLMTIFCERNEQIIRIISARKVTTSERAQYEKRI